MTKVAATIFNSTRHVVEETLSYRRVQLFDSKNDAENFKGPVGQLTFLNEVWLAPAEKIGYTHTEDISILLIPINGALIWNAYLHGEQFVNAEQFAVGEIEKEKTYFIGNPFSNNAVNYLHIGFRAPSPNKNRSFAIEDIRLKKLNLLVPLDLHYPNYKGLMGIYEGRKKGHYELSKKDRLLFTYIIKGAFEVQGRLLEQQEGLSLTNTEKIEFEALSNNAIILLLEIKSNNY